MLTRIPAAYRHRIKRTEERMGLKNNRGKSGSYVVCPMCDMEHDRLMQDPKGWAEHHYYGDSGDPMREAIRAVSLTELEHADVTIPEAAVKAGPSRIQNE